MKITEANIYKIEHDIIRDVCLADITGDESPTAGKDMAMYISGVSDMAAMVIKAIKELRNI